MSFYLDSGTHDFFNTCKTHHQMLPMGFLAMKHQWNFVSNKAES